MSAAATLTGRTVLVTRSREQISSLHQEIESRGATVIDAPVLLFVDPPDWQPLDTALERLDDYHWILFTSQTTVPRLVARMKARGLEPGALSAAGIVAIGEPTARALGELGLAVEMIADDSRAEGVLELLGRTPLTGKRVLLPRALVARETLPEGLRARGAVVDVVPVYQTMPDVEGAEVARQALVAGSVDAVTFTSSSTVTFLLGALESDPAGEALRHLRQTCLASIGPVTSTTLRGAGLEPTVEARPATIGALVEALVEHFTVTASEESE